MSNEDTRIGVELTVVAKHAGHKVTVVRRDIEKHKAYWLRCECGAETLIGTYWLDRAIARGTLAHGAIAQQDDLAGPENLLHRAEQVGK
jgi:hypothetical protein